MGDSGSIWWMTESGEWRQGTPPPGWWQASDGNFYPPQAASPPADMTPPAGQEPLDADERTVEMHLSEEDGGEHSPEPGFGGEESRAHVHHAGFVESYRRLPLWARIAIPATVVLFLVTAAVAAAVAPEPDDSDVASDGTTTTEPETTTTEKPTTTTSTSTTTTTAPPTTTTTAPPPPTTTAPPPPPPTEPATPAPPPPTEPPPPPAQTVTAGAFCSPAGATGVTTTGLPMTCATQSCEGKAYTQPRWRRAAC